MGMIEMKFSPLTAMEMYSIVSVYASKERLDKHYSIFTVATMNSIRIRNLPGTILSLFRGDGVRTSLAH